MDILHDVGTSLNPAMDLGQVEGGFLQGAGWLTSEELWWDARGQLGTHAPSTYKIPAASDWPADARVRLLERAPNVEDTIFRSKAVGEPPLMLAISVFHADPRCVRKLRRAGRAARAGCAGDAGVHPAAIASMSEAAAQPRQAAPEGARMSDWLSAC